MNGEPRHVTLCADDYGISPGVNRAICDLISKKRLNATSVMVVGAAIGRGDVAALKQALASNSGCEVGLHTTLTAPFHPLTMHFKPLEDGFFLPLGKMLRVSLLRQLDPEIVRAEIAAQLALFIELFGKAPDYVDGHQHVQLFPQVRDAFVNAVKDAAPRAWVRQCGRNRAAARLNNPKALLLDVLSAKFRRLCARSALTFNPGFAGAYDFNRANDFAGLMDGFVKNLPAGGLVMCHPGFVDDTLISLDPLTHQREREYEFLASDNFPKVLAANNVRL
ncbi:MAG: ChbG/HpnK family deacetylase [Xanthobacteraceae bacterium]|nr:ChbG/HpnK family deacetylase [Xanthobacteraceae bacterium]